MVTNNKIINVLGTDYAVNLVDPDHDPKLKINKDGYTDTSIKVCVIDTMQEEHPDIKVNITEYRKSVIRHELIHAFLFESGLDSCSWATNEEMVDWLAIQFPKMLKAFEEADAL